MINGIEKNDTREEYINRDSDFSTYAVITKDGKWHEKGRMGWWGISDETPEKKNNWKYLIRFKEGAIPTLYEEFSTIVKENNDRRRRRRK